MQAADVDHMVKWTQVWKTGAKFCFVNAIQFFNCHSLQLKLVRATNVVYNHSQYEVQHDAYGESDPNIAQQHRQEKVVN